MAGSGCVRVGILGQGRSGRDIHAEWLVRSPEKYRIVAVSDLLRDRRDRAVREFECDAYADYRDVLARNDVELVVNALPSHLHTQRPRRKRSTRVIMSCVKSPWHPVLKTSGAWWRRPSGRTGSSRRSSSRDTRRIFNRYSG